MCFSNIVFLEIDSVNPQRKLCFLLCRLLKKLLRQIQRHIKNCSKEHNKNEKPPLISWYVYSESMVRLTPVTSRARVCEFVTAVHSPLSSLLLGM